MPTRSQPSNHTLGKVFLVGAGPGAADLITVRGAKLLEQADVVFYDALVDPEMLELCPQAEKIPVGKRCGKLSSAQQFINKRLVDAAQKYQIIVRLKGGDPMLFGRADEEITALKEAGIEVEVVPVRVVRGPVKLPQLFCGGRFLDLPQLFGVQVGELRRRGSALVRVDDAASAA